MAKDGKWPSFRLVAAAALGGLLLMVAVNAFPMLADWGKKKPEAK